MTHPADPGRSVLGISADYHDAAAALLIDGELVAAAEEERFTRIKHDPSLPVNAIAWCLEAGGIAPGDLDGVAFYAKPLNTYERILREHASVGPRGLVQLSRATQVWGGSKLWVSWRVERLLRRLGHPMPPLVYAEHHQSHAASAFYPSPFERAAVLTFDGVGEWTTSAIGHGTGSTLSILREQRYPDSLGLLYSTITAQCGFEVNDGEYKLMGLAPYGDPTFAEVLRNEVVRINDDGSVRLDQRWFGFRWGRRMGTTALDELLGGPPRRPEQPVSQREADLARSVQVVLEEAVLAAARHARAITGESRACLAGGVALNCVANARLRDDGPFEEIWVQPAAGDAGGAPGAAWWTWHVAWGRDRAHAPVPDGMRGCRLGPAFSDDDLQHQLDSDGVAHRTFADLGATCRHVADRLAEGDIVGWFQGPMEFGPRALGQRSILADPRDPTVVARLNASIKQREAFRPFAPSVLAGAMGDWFDPPASSPYMLFTSSVRSARRRHVAHREVDSFAVRLGQHRSEIPACTHVDHSARVQTVDERSPELAALLRAFEDRTGCPVLVNTSFNGAGEPIVCSPADALRTFRETGLDVLVLGRHVVARSEVTGATP